MATKGPKRKIEPLRGQKAISSFFQPRNKPTNEDLADVRSKAITKLEEKVHEAEAAASAGPEEKGATNSGDQRGTVVKLTAAAEEVAAPVARRVSPRKQAKVAPTGLGGLVTGNSAVKDAAGTYGSEIIGRKCRVYWPDDDDWYHGEVSQYDAPTRRHAIAYDDGDQEWVDLARERFELLPSDIKAPRRKRPHTRVLDSSDSEEDGAACGSGRGLHETAASSSNPASSSKDKVLEDMDIDMQVPQRKRPFSKIEELAASKASKRAATTSANTLPCKKEEEEGRPLAAIAPVTPAAPKQPTAAHKAALSKALASAGSVMPDTPPATTGKSVLSNDMQRYAMRSADRFPFLHPDKVQDANKRRPGDPGYNSRTLYLAADFFKKYKISEGQQQWWEFKSAHFDSVMLFKMGKFYEMLEWDAHVGAEVLGLSYMKGDQPHCGFPEARYHENAERLARAGLRVVIVEQVETPEQLRLRNEQRKMDGQSKANVVAREMVAVLTKGTLSDPEMLTCQSEASYVMALLEAPAAKDSSDAHRATCFGACVFDVATGQIMVGQWADDEVRTELRAHLAELRPVEVVLARDALSEGTRKVLRAGLRSPRVNELDSFWDAARTLKEIEKAGYFVEKNGEGSSNFPPLLQALSSDAEASENALSALGGCIKFLRDILLDKTVLPLGRLEALARTPQAVVQGVDAGPLYVNLDGAAFDNLEVLENTNGGTEGTLMAGLDHCATTAGRRRLRAWLCRPLARVADITARQDAVQDLMHLGEVVDAVRKHFKGVGDLERMLARLHANSGAGHGRDADNVVLYEDASKRRLLALHSALRGLQSLQAGMAELKAVDMDMSSQLLRDLVTPGSTLPDLAGPLGQLLEATDWDAAAAEGRIIPKEGIDAAYDEADAALQEVDQELKSYLKQVCKTVGNNVTYVQLHKETHVLEIPEGSTSRVPGSFEQLGQRKGFLRYMSPTLRDLVTRRADAVADRNIALAGILKGLLRKFASQHELWSRAVDALAQLDALMSLAAAAEMGGTHGNMCRPKFLLDDACGGQQVLRAASLRHPAADALQSVFVPNDIQLGGQDPPFLLLTGPNMGGKSTLLRQVCLAALLAHVGAWVPAEEFELTPVDAIFVRMGARDAIMSGQSTFLVELSETAAALHRATHRSLVALDELGRGTATTDGAAIAEAVLQYMTGTVKCRALFASHYHKLADACSENAAVSIRHMACRVSKCDDGADEVTFLYKLTAGACPKSYGVNVARLAGIPPEVVKRAYAFAADLEAGGKFRGQGGPSLPATPSLELLMRPAEAEAVQRIRVNLQADDFADLKVAQQSVLDILGQAA